MKTFSSISIFIFLLSFIFIKPVKAENNGTGPASHTVSGKVIDQLSGGPMEYVNIALYKIPDSAMITGTITDAAGSFEISRVPFGDYYLEASFMGYNKLKTAGFSLTQVKHIIEVPEIKLSPAAEQLKAFEVTAEKSRIEYKIDKRVVNVDKDIAARGGTAVNVLENTPSVQVDAQGNVTLRGSSDYLVLIDGKPSVVKGSDALKQIPSGSIRQIEIITNPSAKYDVEGQAGIINLILKKEKLQGVNGTIDLSAGTADKYTSNTLINFRKNKLNLFTGVDFARNKYISTINARSMYFRDAGNHYINSDIHQAYHNDNLTFKGGLDYNFSAKSSFSLSGSYGEEGYDNSSETSYQTWQDTAISHHYFKSPIYNDIMGRVTSLTADIQHTFSENHTLSISNFYASWDGKDDSRIRVENTGTAGIPSGLQSAIHYVKHNNNYRYRLNIDYKRPIKNGTFEAGTQIRYEYRYDDLVFKNYDIADEQWVFNPVFSNISHYNNTIYSGYALYQSVLFGLGYQLGVRSEYFTRNIRLSNELNDYQYDKFMLYPSFHISKDFNGKQQLQASYSRRINRPVPYLLNNNPSYIDPTNIFKGSPTLKPEFTDAYELNYRYAGKIITPSIQTYFRNTTNSFSTKRTLGSDGIMYHEQTNANLQQAAGVELGADINLAKWWQINTGANIYHYTIKAKIYTAEESRTSDSWDARLVSNFSLKWGTRLQATTYYRAPSIDIQGDVTDFYVADLAISQSFMKGKVNLSLAAENIFNTVKYTYSMKDRLVHNNYEIQGEGQVFMINFSYSFNNFQNKQRGRNDDASFGGGKAF